MQEAFDALRGNNGKEVEKLKGMSSWSANALLEIWPQFIECLSDSVEQDRLDRWAGANYATQVWSQLERKGSFTMS